MKRLARFAALFVVASFALPLAAQVEKLFQPGKLRVLIFSGRNNHDWRVTTPLLRRILESSGRFDTRVSEEPSGISAAALAPYDAVVLDYNGPRWGAPAETALLEFVRSGKGLVVVHGAAYAFHGLDVLGDRHVRTGIFEAPWADYANLIGTAWSNDEPKSGHGDRHIFTVKFTDRGHPVAQGMGESFLANDELYHNMRMRPSARVLATAFDDPKRRGTGKEEPILWTVQYGKGRVFHTLLGHDDMAMMEPGFITTFTRGAEWAATAKVGLPAVISLDRRREDDIRVQITTGGHDFAPTFHTIFTEMEGVTANVVNHPGAYRRDLRDRVDVLVLYDMVQEVEAKQKANLQAFVESGKGLVVLHHAIANFQDWKWWYEEVVGGKYILGKEGSKFKHDEEVFVEVAAKHPVTAGIGPLRIYDEVYKDMWFSPGIEVLLTTNHPLSDKALAWISPYRKSRVVYIELGHGPEAHMHPGYRKLVRNAVFWAAGRPTAPPKPAASRD